MAEEKRKATYPYIPTKNWWDLRAQFRRSKPSQVTAGYLQTTLQVGDSRAGTLVGQLRTVGLIDADGSPTELAEDWRDDERYREACRTILEGVYPAELRQAQPPPEPNRAVTTNWFMRNAGVGQGAAGQMAQFYDLLAQADVSGQSAARAARGSSSKTATAASNGPKPRSSTPKQRTATQKTTNEQTGRGAKPSISVAVQVYIPSDATAEQIDSIFASMAKHFSAA